MPCGWVSSTQDLALRTQDFFSSTNERPVTDTGTIAAAPLGLFTRDQVEILAARKDEPGWLRDGRLEAQEAFAAAPMPSRAEEDWRYSYAKLGKVLQLDAFAFAEERGPVASAGELPAGLTAIVAESGETSARLAQVDSSVVWRELPEELAAQGVIFTSLEAAAREHPELVQRYLGTALKPEDGKFAAMNAAFWTGGVFI